MSAEHRVITLMRHGQVPANKNHLIGGADSEQLTSFGIRQSEKRARALRREGITDIYCSPLARARQTAEIVAGIVGLTKVEHHPGLAERNVKGLFGIHQAQVGQYAETLPVGDRNYAVSMLDGTDGIESFPALLERAGETLFDIRERHPSGHVLLVAHSVVGRMLYAAHHGLTWRQGLEALSKFPNAATVKLI